MALKATAHPDIGLATRLFSALYDATFTGPGVTRASYGSGENMAHEIVRTAGQEIGLRTTIDDAGNLYVTLPGRSRSGKEFLIGSHLDSVANGGNYDGAAGVIAGLSALAGLKQAGVTPEIDVTVMAIRGEESMWFPCAYIGSRAALGLLDLPVLDEAKRVDSGRSLADHMRDCGFDPDALRQKAARLGAERIQGFVEVHIEQGPHLDEQGVPVGVVTGIRGNFRHRNAICTGEYGHCGTVPRHLRHDAISAVADLVTRMNQHWLRLEEEGQDLAVTFGIIQTDPEQHAVSKIAGRAAFAVDVRSQSQDTLTALQKLFDSEIAEVGSTWGVAFELGYRSVADPALIDPAFRAQIAGSAQDLGVPYIEMPSGAGHDASVFANIGIPTAMVFIRNKHGSHNPREAMAMCDFEQAALVLTEFLSRKVL